MSPWKTTWWGSNPTLFKLDLIWFPSPCLFHVATSPILLFIWGECEDKDKGSSSAEVCYCPPANGLQCAVHGLLWLAGNYFSICSTGWWRILAHLLGVHVFLECWLISTICRAGDCICDRCVTACVHPRSARLQHFLTRYISLACVTRFHPFGNERVAITTAITRLS